MSEIDWIKLLTPLELAVVEQLLTGATNKEIGRQLQLSPFTIREYVQRIARKLNCRNRVEVVAVWTAVKYPYIGRVSTQTTSA